MTADTRKNFRRAPSDRRRHDLIRATLDCVAERGLQAATVREIAVRAGVTNGLIRHHFVSKDQMIQEAYRYTMAEMTSLAKAAGEAAGPGARDRLVAFITANLSSPILDSRWLTLWANFIGMVAVDPVMAGIHREHYLAFRRELEPLIDAALGEAGSKADAARCRVGAIKINAAIDGLWLEGILAPELFTDQDIVTIGIETVEAILAVSLRRHGQRG